MTFNRNPRLFREFTRVKYVDFYDFPDWVSELRTWIFYETICATESVFIRIFLRDHQDNYFAYFPIFIEPSKPQIWIEDGDINSNIWRTFSKYLQIFNFNFFSEKVIFCNSPRFFKIFFLRVYRLFRSFVRGDRIFLLNLGFKDCFKDLHLFLKLFQSHIRGIF